MNFEYNAGITPCKAVGLSYALVSDNPRAARLWRDLGLRVFGLGILPLGNELDLNDKQIVG